MSSLPRFLINRFKVWKKISYSKNANKYKKLAEFGQKPRAMIISCCDSRIQPTSIFQAEEGDFFVHRNIANLIPSHNSTSNDFSTLAAIEYAIKELKIPDIVILGHTDCGGIKSGHSHHSKGPNKDYKFNN